jgi:ATP-binding cassette subfamily B protein
MAAIMQGLNAERYDRQYSDKELIQRIRSYFGKYKAQVILVVVAVVLLAALQAAPAVIISRGIDIIADGGNVAFIPLLIGIVFADGLLIWLVNWVKRLYSVKVIESVILDMRTKAFGAAARQDLSFYDEFSSGRIVSRITSDTDEFGRIIILVTDLVQQVASSLMLLVLLITIEVRLTVVLLCMIPVVFLVANGFRSLARRATTQASRVLGEVNKSIQEAVTGIGVAKNFRQEQAIYDEFLDVNKQAYDINLRRAVVIALIFPTLAILLGVATAALVYFGGIAAISGAIAISAWYLFVATVDRFWFPLLNLSAFWSQFQQGLAAAERIFALVDSESSVMQTGTIRPKKLDGRIEFRHVDFSYNQREQILNDFSITIQPGETLAIVGHTGAGKSSIMRLVTRFYEFQAGEIYIDDYNLRDLDLTAYREQLGIVSQIPFLFEGTVADNIRYGRPAATDEEIVAVAHQIGGGEWLETLPDGLASTVGERGSRLSMGQRQLVALTRVLVSNPRIFIFDEATANIDPFTETQIQEALQLVMQTRTSIVIAHRLSTVRSADRIIVLSNGQIIEQGSHKQLMELGGEYAELYNAYFRHQSLDYIEQRGWEGNTVNSQL